MILVFYSVYEGNIYHYSEMDLGEEPKGRRAYPTSFCTQQVHGALVPSPRTSHIQHWQ